HRPRVGHGGPGRRGGDRRQGPRDLPGAAGPDHPLRRPPGGQGGAVRPGPSERKGLSGAAMALEVTTALSEVAAATSGRVVSGAPAARVSGVTIDSRRVEPGQLFVAIAGPRFDGHDFVAEAAARGAAAALVHRDLQAPAGFALVRVADTTRGLADLAGRARAQAEVPVVCITGSAGKTTTKDMTAALLAARGPVLKTEGNLNNRYGVPLTLLRLAPEHR